MKTHLKGFIFSFVVISIISGVYIYIANQAPEIKDHFDQKKLQQENLVKKEQLNKEEEEFKSLMTQHGNNCYSKCIKESECNNSLISCDILKNYLKNSKTEVQVNEYKNVLKRLCELGEKSSC